MKALWNDLLLFCKAWKLAAEKIVSDQIARYRPEARHLIVFHQVCDELQIAGMKAENITGCVVHAAIALCYRFKKSLAKPAKQ